MKCTKQYEVDSKGNVEPCVAGGIMWVLRPRASPLVTAPPSNLTRLLHDTASYAGHQNSDGFNEQNKNSASASRFSVNVSGAPNDGFLLNTLKTLFQVFYPEYL